MTIKDAVVRAIKYRNLTYKALAEKIEYSSGAGIAQRLQGDGSSMSIKILMKLLGGLDCTLVIKSNTDDTEWVINGIEEEMAKGANLSGAKFDPTTNTYILKDGTRLGVIEHSSSTVETSSSTSDALPSVNDTSKPKERRLGTIPLPDLSGYTKEEIREMNREYNEEEIKRAMGIPVDTPKPEPRKSVKIPLTPITKQESKYDIDSLLNMELES